MPADTSTRTTALATALLLAILVLNYAARAQDVSSQSALPDSLPVYVLPDTVNVTAVLPAVIVSAERVAAPEVDEEEGFEIGSARIRDRAEPSVAALGAVLPSTQLGVNSRGESYFLVRGASERHLRVDFDGMPLTVPWDERADLSLLPTQAVGSLRFSRGVGSFFDGPNALSGVLSLSPREAPGAGRRRMLAFEMGEAGAYGAQLSTAHGGDSWSSLFALAYRERAGWLLPGDYEAAFNQNDHRLRNNSRQRQSNFLARTVRRWGTRGSLRLNLLAFDGSKGVPPETHIADARFWRYPEQRRILLGLAGEFAPVDGGPWGLAGSLATDTFRQEIRSFDDADFLTPSLAPGAPYETDRDRTTTARFKARRAAMNTVLSFGGSFRRTTHNESLEYAGPELRYVQHLASVGGELDRGLGAGWFLKLGAGYEVSATPETGDKEARSAVEAPMLLLRLKRQFPGGLRMHASLSRRSRFPSLRELYSGALGKFVPNPGLDPERQDLLELGAALGEERRNLRVTAYAAQLEGGIEKLPVGDGSARFQRVNVEAIRTLGLELMGSLRPLPGLRLSAQHGWLHARRERAGSFDERAEDRADFVSTLDVTWTHVRGFRFNLEAEITGPRSSADASDEADGLAPLPSESVWNLRCAYLRPFGGDWLSDAELYLRLDNLFDQTRTLQLGLPGPGRTLVLGFRLVDAH